MKDMILIGKIWGILSVYSGNNVLIGPVSKERLINLLNSPEADKIVQRINSLNEAIGDCLEIFNEIVPDPNIDESE